MDTTQLLGTFSKDARGTRHLLTVPVHYEDTDFSGFVYHANYLKFAERGRSNFLNLAGITHQQLLEFEPQLAFVVGHMEMDFLSPGRVEDLLLVETIFTECRGARWWPSNAFRVMAKPCGNRMCWPLWLILMAARAACRKIWPHK